MVPFVSASTMHLEEWLMFSLSYQDISETMVLWLMYRGDLCDFDFNPFNDEQIISASADLTVMVLLIFIFHFSCGNSLKEVLLRILHNLFSHYPVITEK